MNEKKNFTSELPNMQAEAIKRIKEMHLRSKNFDCATNNKNLEDKHTQKFSESNKKSAKDNSSHSLQINSFFQKNSSKKYGYKNSKSKNKTFTNLTELLFKDSDKSLIIILIIMLMDNDENFFMVLSLLYLLI